MDPFHRICTPGALVLILGTRRLACASYTLSKVVSMPLRALSTSLTHKLQMIKIGRGGKEEVVYDDFTAEFFKAKCEGSASDKFKNQLPTAITTLSAAERP